MGAEKFCLFFSSLNITERCQERLLAGQDGLDEWNEWYEWYGPRCSEKLLDPHAVGAVFQICEVIFDFTHMILRTAATGRL